MATLVWITVGISGVWVLVFLKNYFEIRKTPRLFPKPVRYMRDMPSVSIMVPARNEQDNIRRCVRSLMDLVYPGLEIIVIDDRSTDDTAKIVSRLAALDDRVRLLKLDSGPPSGWMGKCNALYQGVRQAKPRGDWLLFTDADTVHHPHSLAVCMREALDHQTDMFSLVPHLEAFNFWERLVQPAVAAIIGLYNRPSRINNPNLKDAFANGQYILISRKAYDSVGGHESVAGKVLEDVELARVVKTVGHWIRFAIGIDIFKTRMYPDFRSLVQGWTKNLFLLLNSKLNRVFSVTLMTLVLSVWPTIAGVSSIVALGVGYHDLVPIEGLLLISFSWVAVMFFQVILRWMNRWYPAMAPLAPIAALVVLFILWRSAWLHRHKSAVVWKDRMVVDDKRHGEP